MPAILDQGFQIARPIVIDTGIIIASAQRRNQLGGSQRSQQRRRRRRRRGGSISRQTGTATSPQHFRFVSVHGIPLEGLNERGDLVNQHAEGVHVRLAVVRPAEGDFRTHVATRTGLGGEFVGSVVVVVVVAAMMVVGWHSIDLLEFFGQSEVVEFGNFSVGTFVAGSVASQ